MRSLEKSNPKTGPETLCIFLKRSRIHLRDHSSVDTCVTFPSYVLPQRKTHVNAEILCAGQNLGPAVTRTRHVRVQKPENTRCACKAQTGISFHRTAGRAAPDTALKGGPESKADAGWC